MKKLFSIIAVVLTCHVASAQNIFPTPTGNVGIGTTSPTAKLQVGAGTSNYGSQIAMFSGAASGGPVIALSLVNNATISTANEVDMSFHTAGTYSPTATIGAIAEATQPTTDLAFSTYSSTSALTEKMRILGNGNILIGKTIQGNPSYLLDVNGTARANSIVVNTTGADFVFKPTYKLAPLTTVEQYIAQNHHLPEIASAKEMQANGLDLGQNQIKLLQKLEELTLYLIDKDKQLSNEKKTNDTQQKLIGAQESANKQMADQLKSQQQKIDLLTAQVAELLKKK